MSEGKAICTSALRYKRPVLGWNSLHIGDVVIRKPITVADKDLRDARPMRGRVIWVHPLGRFHVVEFDEGQRAFRESFMGARNGQ